MRDHALRVLLIDSAAAPCGVDARTIEGSQFGPFAIESCSGLAQASSLLGERAFDGVLLCASAPEAERLCHWPGLSQATPDAAVVVLLPAGCEAQVATGLLRVGVQDLIFGSSVAGPLAAEAAYRLRLAVERKQIEQEARKAHASDLQTGLPNRQQLIDHMSQLLALRGREPAPMALLVLRIEGFATTEAESGRESANVLRRKVAVRLRAAVRASDVVAALGADSYALLLASTEEPLDGDHVARKLLAALHAPFALSGQQVCVSASAGVSRYPADGADAGVLMRRAVAAAAAAQASGRSGFVNWRESLWQDTGAANDGNLGIG